MYDAFGAGTWHRCPPDQNLEPVVRIFNEVRLNESRFATCASSGPAARDRGRRRDVGGQVALRRRAEAVWAKVQIDRCGARPSNAHHF